MFRCQFSGEASDPVIYRTIVSNDRLEDGRWVSKTKRVFVSPVEKPVRIVIETRAREYTVTAFDEEGIRYTYTTQGSEIVRELLVRPRHVEAVKAKYGLA